MTTMRDLLRDFAFEVSSLDIDIQDRMLAQDELIASGSYQSNVAKLDANQIRNELIEEKVSSIMASITERIIG